MDLQQSLGSGERVERKRERGSADEKDGVKFRIMKKI